MFLTGLAQGKTLCMCVCTRTHQLIAYIVNAVKTHIFDVIFL